MASMRRTRSFRAISHHHRFLRVVLLGAAALPLVVASEASAQFAYGYAGTYRRPVYEDDMAPMPPRIVAYRLQDRGFSEIGRPRFDGRAYVVDATNPAGNRVRLYVDATDGSIFGRQSLDAPPARIARAAPGYGWTDDDAGMRRGGRDPEALLPPGDIPLPRPSLRTEIERAPKAAARSGAGNPDTFGVNPDARPGARPEPHKVDKAAPRKTAKLTPPAKPAVPRVSPEAAPAEPTGTTAPEPAKAAVEPPKAETAAVPPAAPLPINEEKAAGQSSEPASAQKPAETPAAPQVADTPAEKPAATAPAAAEAPGQTPKPEAREAANQKWQDPPSGEAKRKVRIIDGATMVPRDSDTAATPAAN